MFENLKNLFTDFDFRLPTSLDDITPGFLTVVVCLVALIVIIISVVILSKKKKQRIIALEQKKENQTETILEPPASLGKTSVSSDGKIRNQQSVAAGDSEKKPKHDLSKAAIRPDISYTASFTPIKVQQPAVPHRPKSAAERFSANHKKTFVQVKQETAERNTLKIEDGFVIVTSVQKNQLEQAYSIALRKCAVNGTSKDLEKLLDAKRMLNMDRIPQKDFEGLMALLFPQR